MIKKLIVAGVFSFITMWTFSQSCGTKIPKDFFNRPQVKSVVEVEDTDIPFKSLPNVNLCISVYYTFSGIDSLSVYSMVDSLNLAFEPSGISFSVCSILPVTEGDYSTIINEENEERLVALYRTHNTINLYLATTVKSDNKKRCGYAYLPNDPPRDVIVIDYDCDLANTLIHEMGHFFGLLHPHETMGGKELVNGSNCGTAGDLICDTEASPNLSGRVSEDCEYFDDLVDENGEYYQPTVSNYMSYSRSECTCRFTKGQYKRIVEFYWSHRRHLH